MFKVNWDCMLLVIMWYSGVRLLNLSILFAFARSLLMNRINFAPRQLGLLLISLIAVMALSGCGGSGGDVQGNAGGGESGAPPTAPCASYMSGDTMLTAMAARTAGAPNCVYGEAFVDNNTPITESLTLAKLDAGGVHVFNGSLIVGEDSPTLAGVVPTEAVVLTIEAGATIAFANAADRLIVNRGAQIMADGTEADPITFTSMTDITDDLAPTATDQWLGIIINGAAFNNACGYADPADLADPAARAFMEDDPFTLRGMQPTLTARAVRNDSLGACSPEGGGLSAVGDGRDGVGLDDGFHGGTTLDDNSGVLNYVIIKHAGNARVIREGFFATQNALQLRSVGSGTALSNIEVYSVDGHGIAIDGGGADLTNVLVYNAQGHGIYVTGGYLGTLDTVLVSQADDMGRSCVEVGGDGAGSAAVIAAGLNARVTLRNLTCDVSADAPGSAGVVVREAARARIQNAIIVGSRVAASDVGRAGGHDNVCLGFLSDILSNAEDEEGIARARADEEAIIEADGVIVSCLEESGVATAANFLATSTVGDRVIATDASTPTATEVAMDIQFHAPGQETTISPLAGTDTGFVALSDAGTVGPRALFSLPLGESTVNGATTTVVASAAAPNDSDRAYLGAIAEGTGNNPFSAWTFGVFVTP